MLRLSVQTKKLIGKQVIPPARGSNYKNGAYTAQVILEHHFRKFQDYAAFYQDKTITKSQLAYIFTAQKMVCVPQ